MSKTYDSGRSYKHSYKHSYECVCGQCTAGHIVVHSAEKVGTNLLTIRGVTCSCPRCVAVPVECQTCTRHKVHTHDFSEYMESAVTFQKYQSNVALQKAVPHLSLTEDKAVPAKPKVRWACELCGTVYESRPHTAFFRTIKGFSDESASLDICLTCVNDLDRKPEVLDWRKRIKVWHVAIWLPSTILINLGIHMFLR